MQKVRRGDGATPELVGEPPLNLRNNPQGLKRGRDLADQTQGSFKVGDVLSMHRKCAKQACFLGMKVSGIHQAVTLDTERSQAFGDKAHGAEAAVPAPTRASRQRDP